MREEIAKDVYEVLAESLDVKEDLAADVPLDLMNVQRKLTGLLQKTHKSRAYSRSDSYGKEFLGIGYILACWIDEIFNMSDSKWREIWMDKTLEFDLYKSHDRAWNFWTQARLAEQLAEPDALEVCYLCVVLGFRGDLTSPDAPQNLQNWCADVRRQIDEARQEAAVPVEKQPITYVPALYGAERLRTMFVTLVICLLVLAPVSTFLFLRPN